MSPSATVRSLKRARRVIKGLTNHAPGELTSLENPGERDIDVRDRRSATVERRVHPPPLGSPSAERCRDASLR